MNESIGVGIVGYGFAGRGFHAPLIRRVPGLAVTAVATRDAGRRAQAEAELAVATFPDLAAMLAAPDVDVVVLATPHDVHAAQAEAALAAGKHVVIDKPMALTAAECDRLIAARDRAGTLLSVFHNRRWDWDFLTVRKALEGGALGDVYRFETSVLRHKAPRGWRGDDATGGGLVFDWGAHLVDQAFQLVPGPLLAVDCQVQRRGWGASAGSYVRLELRFAPDVLYGIEIGNLAAVTKPRWHVLAERGALVKWGLDPQEPALLAGDIDQASEPPEHHARIVTIGDDGQPTERTVASERGDWTAYYANVRDALLGTAPLAVTAEDGRRVVAVLEAATESARSGRPIPF